jgi:hypothetical protein
MLFVHGPGRDGTGVSLPIRDAIFTEDERDRSVQHEHACVELVGVRLAVQVRLKTAFADLVALSVKVGLEFSSGHGVRPN